MGFIGSHTAAILSEAGHRAILFDNLSNSKIQVLGQLKKITGNEPIFIHGDIRDKHLLSQVLRKYQVNAVIHFAGLKAVGESVEKPLDYYACNVGGTIDLLEVMRVHDIRKLVFSSSATVYGEPNYLPINESHQRQATNPYGRSKLYIEEILEDFSRSEAQFSVVCLRYFNPVGAHSSGLIGEDPKGTPNNLMPYIARVAIGEAPKLNIFGDNYPTKDGTGVRDYIHVTDLAFGHKAALDFLESNSGFSAFNLGTGKGVSVFEMLHAFERASGRKIPYEIHERRLGDVASCYADVSKARNILNWHAKQTLDQMCQSTWDFIKSKI